MLKSLTNKREGGEGVSDMAKVDSERHHRRKIPFKYKHS